MVMVVLEWVFAILFTGAALYVSFVEQPARLKLDDPSLLIEWKVSYKRGAAMQAPLALLAFLSGCAAVWLFRAPEENLAVAFLLVANWPYTLLIVRPVNNRLMSTEPGAAGPETRKLIENWGRLHGVRTALGLMATLIILWSATFIP